MNDEKVANIGNNGFFPCRLCPQNGVFWAIDIGCTPFMAYSSLGHQVVTSSKRDVFCISFSREAETVFFYTGRTSPLSKLKGDRDEEAYRFAILFLH